MQKNSNSNQRILLIVGVVALLLVGVLYFTKRIEANKLRASLEDVQNGYASRTAKCEAEKAVISSALEKSEKKKSECINSHEAVRHETAGLRRQLDDLKAQHADANSQLQTHKDNLRNMQQALNTAEDELDICQDAQESCDKKLQRLAVQFHSCQQKLLACQHTQRNQKQPDQFNSYESIGRQNPNQLIQPGGHNQSNFQPGGVVPRNPPGQDNPKEAPNDNEDEDHDGEDADEAKRDKLELLQNPGLKGNADGRKDGDGNQEDKQANGEADEVK